MTPKKKPPISFEFFPPNTSVGDTKLLFYYQNRLASHGLGWDVLGNRSRAPGATNAASPSLGGRGGE